MKKSSLILLIVLGILLIGGGLYFLVIKPNLQTVFGYSTLSISNVEVIDNGARIRIYGVANGAEAVQINFNPSQINQYIQDDGYEATKSVTGSIGLRDPTREFYISKDNSKIFTQIGYYELSLLKSCSNNKPSGLNADVYRVANTKLCVYEISRGVSSDFTGQYIDNTPVLFSIGGSTGTINPSSGNNVLTLNDGRTKVEWVGNLLNFQGLNTPNYGALFDNSEYIKLVRKDAWSSYENLLVEFELNNGIGFFTSTSRAKSEINAYNNALNTILEDKTSNYINSVNINDAKFTNNGLKLDLTTATVFPTFIITLDASDVGIIELKGKPDIVSCVSDKTINSGDTYNTNVKVKNIGEQDGSFYGQLSCSGDSGASGVISEQYVNSGSTINMPVQISGTNTESGIQSNNCNIKIIDRKSGASDSCNFDLDVKYQQNIICEPNKLTCLDSSTLKICNSDGTSFTTQDCEFGCIVLESGEAQCKGEPTQELQCKWYEKEKPAKYFFFGLIKRPAKCGLAGWIWLVGLAFLVVIFVLIVIIRNRIRYGRRKYY